MQECGISIKKNFSSELLYLEFNYSDLKKEHYLLSLDENGLCNFNVCQGSCESFETIKADDTFFKADPQIPSLIDPSNIIDSHKHFLGFLMLNKDCKDYVDRHFAVFDKKMSTTVTHSSFYSHTKFVHLDENEFKLYIKTEHESDKKFEEFKQNLITKISTEYESYKHPKGCFSFFKKHSRTFNEHDLTEMENEWGKCNNVKELLEVFQNQYNFINKISEDDSSLGKRLINIKNEVIKAYPVHSYIHDQLETYIKPENNGPFFYYKKYLRNYSKQYIQDIKNKLFESLENNETLSGLKSLKTNLSLKTNEISKATNSSKSKSSFIKRLKNINGLVDRKITVLENNRQNSL